jgi:hypothetical protein
LGNIKKEDSYFVFDNPIVLNYKYYIKLLLSKVLDYVYKIMLKLYNNKSRPKKYNVSICAIFKNEAHNMKEWVEYHKIIGVKRFYLYNNFSDDSYLEILKPYIEERLVVLIDWPVEKGQMSAYEHCFNNYKEESKWISFLDLDEFVVPVKTESLDSWLDRFSLFPCVLVYWKMFGTSGLIQSQIEKLTIEQYTVSWEKLVNIGKVFWNTDYIISDFTTMHIMKTEIKVLGINISVPPVNQFNKFVFWDVHRANTKGVSNLDMQINHYWSKSFADTVIKKFARGDAFFGEHAPTRNLNSFFYHEYKNTSTDFKIFKYLISLRRALGQTKRIEGNE